MNSFLTIICLSLINILFYLFMNRLQTNVLIEITIIIAFTFATFFFIRKTETDHFFFEVSEGRKKCLEEQVLPIFNRSAGCCGKEMRQGIPANRTYPDLINPDNTWNRVDAFGVEDSMTPPTQTCNDPSIGY